MCVIEETCPQHTWDYYPEMNLCKDNQCFRTFVRNLPDLDHNLFDKYAHGDEPEMWRCTHGCVEEAHG